jgi:hypothetical protein
MRIKGIAAAVTATAFMGALLASPAAAQNQQQGLVNVAVEDVIVQVPVSVAANICDVNVAVLVSEFNDEAAACEATAESTATAGPSGNGPPTQQEGLVNVLLDDILVQVPISVAANVCDVNVALLVDTFNDEAAACVADADAAAQPGPGDGNWIFIPIDIDLGTGTGTAGEPGSEFPIMLLDDNADDGGLGDVVQQGTTVLDSQGDPLLNLTLLD